MTRSHIKIEKLTSFSPNDASAIKELAAKLGSFSKPLSNKDLKEMLTSPTTFMLVARDPKEKKIVGMITLAVYRIPYAKKAYLDDLIVDEMHQGHGIGSKLLEKAIAEAKKLHASFVDLTSRPNRVASNKLYEKFGFKKRDTNVYRLTYDNEKA